jgi:hypothetical protein
MKVPENGGDGVQPHQVPRRHPLGMDDRGLNAFVAGVGVPANVHARTLRAM